MKKIILTTLFLLPTLAFAEMPAFPMAFYGSAAINDSPAPIGTIIRAYYGDINADNLAGEVTVKENGIYGYDISTGQRLLVKESSGKIVFTFQSPSILSGQEKKGANEISYASFESGITKELNMAFKYEVTTPVVPPANTGGGSSSGRGGGGGGGGGGSKNNTATVLPTSGQVLGSSVFNFTRSLSIGSTGADVTELQNRLKAEGVYNGPITGYFGSLTGVAVKAFQAKYGIQQLGIVGPMTLAKLNQGGAVLGSQTTAMTTEQMKTLITQLQAQLAALIAQLNSLAH